MKNSKIIITLSIFLFFTNTLFAPDWSVSTSEVGPFGNDNFTLNLGPEFKGGDTISSSEMNYKFAEIKALLERLILLNSLAHDNSSTKIIYFTDGQRPSDGFWGRAGADNLCQSDWRLSSIINSHYSNCSQGKALIGTTDLPLENIFDDEFGPIYSHKGTKIANNWSEFVNLNDLDLNDVGGYDGITDIWIGTSQNSSESCSDWMSMTGNGATSYFAGSPVWKSGTSISCNSWRSIMCICE